MMAFFFMMVFLFSSVSSCGGLVVLLCFLVLMMKGLGSQVVFLGMNSFIVFLDSSSYWLALMSVWVFLVCFMGMSMGMDLGWLNFWMLLLMNFVMSSFFWKSFVGFYICFEFCLVPIIIIVLGWGYQPERVQAGLYMFLYTSFTSLPLLVMGLLGYMSCVYSVILKENREFGSLMIILLNIAFLVKIPMFGVHLWLPKAHVEAPFFGSMILAGILLKLGGYGFLRFFFSYFLEFSGFLVTIHAIMGGAVVSVICMGQVDMKSLVALSSVVHMSLMIGSISSGSTVGYYGGYMMMISHGFCSSGLFYGLGVLYKRSGSRSFVMNSGVGLGMSGFMLFWFLLCVVNMGVPPSINFLSEIQCMIGVFFLLLVFNFTSLCYSFYVCCLQVGVVYG